MPSGEGTYLQGAVQMHARRLLQPHRTHRALFFKKECKCSCGAACVRLPTPQSCAALCRLHGCVCMYGVCRARPQASRLTCCPLPAVEVAVSHPAGSAACSAPSKAAAAAAVAAVHRQADAAVLRAAAAAAVALAILVAVVACQSVVVAVLLAPAAVSVAAGVCAPAHGELSARQHQQAAATGCGKALLSRGHPRYTSKSALQVCL